MVQLCVLPAVALSRCLQQVPSRRITAAPGGGAPRCWCILCSPGRKGVTRHSPLVFHNKPNGVADISVLLMGAELHLHAHLLLLALNVL